MPCVISWGYDRCVFFGAGARSARYIHGGPALSRTNGRTTLNDHRGRTRNDLRVIFVLCVRGRIRKSSRATCTINASVRNVRENGWVWHKKLGRTLIGGIINEEVKVIGFSKTVREDDLLLEVENGYPCAVECDPRLCSLGRELVENGGRHKLRKKDRQVYTTSTTGGDEKIYCERGWDG